MIQVAGLNTLIREFSIFISNISYLHICYERENTFSVTTGRQVSEVWENIAFWERKP